MLKKVLVLILVFVCVLPAAAAAATRIKLGVVTKPGSAQNIVAEKFRELLEKRSGKDLQVQMNTVQMGIITDGPFDTFDPIVRVINYPFLFKDNAQADAILDGPLGARILKSLESSGFKGLCFSENGFRNLTNSKRPVKGPADIKGLKIRVMASALHKAIWQALGANPTPMPWPIYTELEQGVIDGQENPLWVLEVYKFYEIQKYMTLTRHVYSSHIDVASLKWWQTLDPATQKLIQESIYEAALFQRADNRAKDGARLELLKKKGMMVEEAPNVGDLRGKVSGLKDMDLFKTPSVQSLLLEMLDATR